MQVETDIEKEKKQAIHVWVTSSLFAAIDEYRWAARTSLTQAVRDLIQKGLEATGKDLKR